MNIFSLFISIVVASFLSASHASQRDLFDAGPFSPLKRLGSNGSSDTGYETRTPHSSQSSVHVEVGTPGAHPLQDLFMDDAYVAETPVFQATPTPADEGHVEDDVVPNTPVLPQPPAFNPMGNGERLIMEIDETYHGTPPLWFWTPDETEALADLKRLAQKKRAFKNHVEAWVTRHLKTLTPRKRLAITNTLKCMIDFSENDYRKRQSKLMRCMQRMGVSKDLVKRFETDVLIPHDKRCRAGVQRCSTSIKAFGKIKGVQAISERRKLLPKPMIRKVLGEITNVMHENA